MKWQRSMSDSHPCYWSEEQLLAQCRLTFSRASGPGGQNRNKVETSVQIVFLPTNVIAAASERRTQNENRKVAIQRLRCKLAVEFRCASADSPKEGFKASEVWLNDCRNGRIDIAESNTDWPIILAEMIESLRIVDWNIGQAAQHFGTSSSQLVKLLKRHSPAFLLLNAERKSRGQRPME